MNGAADTLSYAGTSAANSVTVDLATGTASGFNSISDILNATGGSGNDFLIAGVGNNTLTGGAGSDTFTVNDTGDVVSEAGGTGGGVDLVNSSVTYTISDGDVENLTLLGVANINGTGNGSANVITGNSGNNILAGLGGNDTVNGGGGNDTFNYTIGDGADTIDGGGHTTADILNITGGGGGETLDVIWNGTSITNFEGGTVTGVETVNANLGGGTDTLNFAGSTSGVTVNLATPSASGFASIVSIENVTGGSGVDNLTGGTGTNILTGGGGADNINMGAVAAEVVDIVRFSDTIDFGDLVTNFDANGRWTVSNLLVRSTPPMTTATTTTRSCLPQATVAQVR